MPPLRPPTAELQTELLQAWSEGVPITLYGTEIPAARLRELLLNSTANAGAPDPRGLIIRGATVTGVLDLDHSTLRTPLIMEYCEFRDLVSMVGTEIPGRLSLQGCTLPNLRLDGAHIKGTLKLNSATVSSGPEEWSVFADELQVDGDALFERLHTSGPINLASAEIGGMLTLRSAQIRGVNQRGYSLVAPTIQVDGMAFLDRGFATTGAVTIASGRIEGVLSMGGASLGGVDDGGYSLNAQGLQVSDDLHMDHVRSAGGVTLSGARVTGQISLTSADLGETPRDGTSQPGGYSLNAQQLQADGGVFLRHLRSAGGLTLTSARIRALFLEGAHLGSTPDQWSLHMRDAEISGPIQLSYGFTSVGGALLSNATVTGALTLDGAVGLGPDEHSLDGRELKVAGETRLIGAFTADGVVSFGGAKLGYLEVRLAGIRGMLDLDHAELRELDLDLRDVPLTLGGRGRQKFSSSTTGPTVSLDYCSYSNRPQGKRADLRQWLALLRHRTLDYQGRAYQQLARVHSSAGHERDAGTILMQQRDHQQASVLRIDAPGRRWEKVGLMINRVGLRVSKAVLGYGHRPERAVGWLVVLIVLAVAIAWGAANTANGLTGEMVARRPAVVLADGTATAASQCTWGDTGSLAARMAVPLINNLAQGNCAINTAASWGGAFFVLSFGVQLLAWILGAFVLAAVARAWRRPS